MVGRAGLTAESQTLTSCIRCR